MVHGASFKLVGGENHSSSILPAERRVVGSSPGGGGLKMIFLMTLSGFWKEEKLCDSVVQSELHERSVD